MYCNCLYNNFRMVLSFEKSHQNAFGEKGGGVQTGWRTSRIKQEQMRGQILIRLVFRLINIYGNCMFM